MNIVIAGGQTKADFLISMFKKEKHNIVVINDSYEYAEYLSKKHHIDVIVGDATSPFILNGASIENFDIIIAITPSDTDNLMICQLGKKLLNIHKSVASVENPKNVLYFNSLGVDTALSATFLISKYIEKASILENVTRTIVTEFDSLSITTITVQDNTYVITLPLSGITSFIIILISVDLPQPFLPITATRSSLYIDRFIGANSCSPSYSFVKSFNVITVILFL